MSVGAGGLHATKSASTRKQHQHDKHRHHDERARADRKRTHNKYISYDNSDYHRPADLAQLQQVAAANNGRGLGARRQAAQTEHKHAAPNKTGSHQRPRSGTDKAAGY
jgi:hypothetical protein